VKFRNRRFDLSNFSEKIYRVLTSEIVMKIFKEKKLKINSDTKVNGHTIYNFKSKRYKYRVDRGAKNYTKNITFFLIFKYTNENLQDSQGQIIENHEGLIEESIQ